MKQISEKTTELHWQIEESRQTRIKTSSFGDKRYASCAREIPDLGKKKMLASPIGDMTRFSGKKENEHISVIMQ